MFRNMRRKRQVLPESVTIAMLQSCTSGVLAVHGDDGYPYAVPLSFAYEDGRLFFHSATAGHKLDALDRDEKASFCVIAADDIVQSTFTTHYRSAIVFGTARVVTDDAEKRHALQSLAKKYSPDYLEAADAEIDGGWKRVCVVELAIEHMTGKASLELVKGTTPPTLTNEGPFVVSEPCPVCDGQGTIDEQPCDTCRGTGVRRFFHGTKAVLRPGDLIGPGYESNFGKRKKASFVYLTGTLDAATWGAELAVGDGPGRIYTVEPIGPIEDDPNLTDKKFPGNPTKSYRTREPLRVTAEVTDWQGHPPEQLKAMRDFLEEAKRRGVEAIDD